MPRYEASNVGAPSITGFAQRTALSTPHVHMYAGRVGHPGVQAARISIDTGDVIDGQLAPAKVATVRNWCERHRDALRSDWQRA
ncbi:MAG: DUF4160 domain-containing protein [Solirubrobacteraceae bacterium]